MQSVFKSTFIKGNQMKFVSKSIASSIVSAFKGEAAAIVKARIAQDNAIQKMLDFVTINADKPKAEFLKGNAKTNAARGEVKAVFDSIVESGFLSKASAATYQTCFWIAFETGVPFSRDLANKQSKESKATSKTKSGGIESTDRAALDKTICKALKQARLLGLLEFAADLVDLATDSLDGFTESAE